MKRIQPLFTLLLAQPCFRIISLSHQWPQFAIRSLRDPLFVKLNFELTLPGNAPVMISLLDIYGRFVRMQIRPFFRGVTSTTITGLDALPYGIYTLYIHYKDQMINRQV